MAAGADLNINVGLPFPQAGVVFNLRVNSGPEGSAEGSTTFELDVKSSSNGDRVSFTPEQCPQLADWVRGYSRWLYRARVRATHDQRGITGTFEGDPTVQQVLEGLQIACEMITQRFELYESSILV